ncbi:MAG: DUF2029 domain-containing protein, partial [Thermoguttaceae bacterium]|nr:DUF2029 domain-containing protein [Thermoguttaceae bacterium]
TSEPLVGQTLPEDQTPSSCPPLWWNWITEHFSPLPGPRWLWWVVLGGAIVIWGVADIRLRGLPWPERPLEHKTDFTVYTTAGGAFFTGENPYEVTNPRGWKYLYPPLFALVVAPLSLLPPAEQCLVWYFISVVFCWGCYREASRILKGFKLQTLPPGRKIAPKWLSFLGFLAFLAALFPTLNCLQRGQVGVLKLYLLLLGARLVWQSPRWIGQSLGGLVLAGAIVLKLTPALAVGMLLWSQFLAVLSPWWRRRKPSKDASAIPGTATNFIQNPYFVYITDQIKLPYHTTLHPIQNSPSDNSNPSSGPGRPWAQIALAPFGATLLGVAAGLILFFFLIPAIVLGWQKNLEHLGYWARRVLPSAGEGFPVETLPTYASQQTQGPKLLPANYRTVRNQSLSNGMFRLASLVDYLLWGGPDDRRLDYVATAPNRIITTSTYQTLQKAVRGVLLVAVLLAGGLLGVSGSRLGQGAAFGLGCVGILVLSPVSWGHYFMLLAPGVLFIPFWLLQEGRPRAAFWMAVLPVLLSVSHYAFLDVAGRMGLLGLGTGSWLLATCILVLQISLFPTSAAEQSNLCLPKATSAMVNGPKAATSAKRTKGNTATKA